MVLIPHRFLLDPTISKENLSPAGQGQKKKKLNNPLV